MNAILRVKRVRSQESIEVQPDQFLTQELAKLKKLLSADAAQELTVCWIPRQNHELSGEVLGSKIVIYDENQQDAINTLKHEYLDFLLTRKMIEPLTTIINTLIKLEADKIYKEKERVVNCLLKLV